MTNITTFLAANAGLNLKTADLFSADALAQYNWPTDTDQKQLLQQLRTRQRMLKVYPDENVAAALEGLGFHSAHHIASLDADEFAQKAVPAVSGITGVSDPAALCAKIAGNAARIRHRSLELALAKPRTLEQAISLPGVPVNTNPDFQQGIPDYARLFGPMYTCDCDDCQSIYGPAAYFTDLMRVVTNYVKQPSKNKFTLRYRRPDLWTMPLNCNAATTTVSYLDIVNTILKQNIQTNYASDSDPMQKIAKANYPFDAPFNEPLETIRLGLKEMGTSLQEVYKLMNAAAPAAGAAALHLSPEQLSLIKDKHADDLYVRYGFTSAPDDIGATLSVQKTFLQQTGLTPGRLEALVYQDNNPANKPIQETGSDYCLSVEGNGAVTGNITSQQLLGDITIEMWLYPNSFPASPVYRTNPITKSYCGEFAVTINEAGFGDPGRPAGTVMFFHGNDPVSCSNPSQAIKTYSCLTDTALLCNTWNHVAITRKASTGESYIYFNGIQAAHNLPSDYAPLTGPTNCPISLGYGYLNVPFDGLMSEVRIWSSVLSSAQIMAGMYTRLSPTQCRNMIAYWPLNEHSGTIAADLGPNGYNAVGEHNLAFRQNNALLLNEPGDNNILLPLLYLNGVSPSGKFLVLTGNNIETQTHASVLLTDGFSASPPDADALNQLAAMIRLQEHTGWSFADLDWILKSVAGSQKTVNDTVIEKLGLVITLQQQYQVPPDELTALWYDMKTYGNGYGALPQDLWDRVFNSPPLLGGSNASGIAVYYRPVYSGNPLFASTPFKWTYKISVNAQDQMVSNLLAAALRVSGSDLAAIVSAVSAEDDSMWLTVQNMSLLYRMARFAQMLQLAVPDFIRLLQASNLLLTLAPGSQDVSVCWSLDQTIIICRYAAWLKKSRLRTDQLLYLTTPGASTARLQLPDTAQTETAITGMINSATPYLITAASFVSDRVDLVAATAIYQQLLDAHYINENGIVLNGYPLTTNAVYSALTSNTVLSQLIYANNPQPEVVSFDSAEDGTCLFNFDPFANDQIQKTNSFTISYWVRVQDTMSLGWPRMMGNAQTDGGNPEKSPSFVQNQDVDHSIQISYGYNNNYYTATANVFDKDEQWVYLCWVNDNGTWTLYRNGVVVPFDSNPVWPVGGIFKQTVSSPTYYLSTAFNGYMTNVAIWNTAHPAETVDTIMIQGPDPAAKDLVAWWPMNEGEGLVIYNRSSNPEAVDGTLSGSASWHSSKSFGLTRIAAAVCNTLQTAKDGQDTLVIKTLAPLAGVSTPVMEGICTLSGAEVDNAVAAGVSSGNVPYAPNLLLVPVTTTDDTRTAYIGQLQRNTALARWFKLTGPEAAGLSTYSQKLGTTRITYGTVTYTIAQLVALSEYKAFQQLCNDPEGLITYFQLAPALTDPDPNTPTEAQFDLLAQLTGWNKTELQNIVNETYFSAINFNTITGLQKIARIMALEEQLGMGIVSLNQLRNIATYNASDNGNWQSYRETAAAVGGALQVKTGDTGTTKVKNKISIQERNTLCSWLIWKLSGAIAGVSNRNELYEYLLIDVNMSPDVQISWTVAAMNSLQLYVNRCISNMEPGAINTIPPAWWEWMNSYRVWQANREVYLYPENYVDPTLRKVMSLQYKSFVSDLAQGQMTTKHAREALAEYLSGINEVTNLEVVDAYYQKMTSNLPGIAGIESAGALYLIGRSRTMPYAFYSRTAVLLDDSDSPQPVAETKIHFGPWNKIKLGINSDRVTTAVAFGRQFVFWVEQTIITNTNPSVTTTTSNSYPSETTDLTGNKYKSVYATIYYTYRDFSDTWIQPAILKKDILVEVFGDGISFPVSGTTSYKSYLNGAQIYNKTGNTDTSYYYLLPQWNSVRVQQLPAGTDAPEQLLILFGDIVYATNSLSSSPQKTNLGTNSNPVPAEAETMQDMLYAAASAAYGCKPNYTTIIPAMLLDSKLKYSERPLTSIDLNDGNAVMCSGDMKNGLFKTSFYIAPAKLENAEKSSGFNSLYVPKPYYCWPMITNQDLVTGETVTEIMHSNNALLNADAVNSSIKASQYPYLNFVNFSGGSSASTTAPYAYADASLISGLSEFTVSCWVNINSGTSTQNILSLYYSNGSQNYGWTIYYSNGKFYLQYGNGSSNSTFSNSTSVSLNNWYFIAFTVKDGSMKLTVNETTTAASGTYHPVPSSVKNLHLFFGSCSFITCNSPSAGYYGPNFNYLYGTLANIKFWGYQLTTDQLKEEYTVFSMDLIGTKTDQHIQRVGNTLGGFIYNNYTQAYLLLPDFSVLPTSECLSVLQDDADGYLAIQLATNPVPAPGALVLKQIRINTDTIPLLIRELATGGVERMMQTKMQYLPETPSTIISPSNQLITDGNTMNFNGASGIYFWELFFYIPYLISSKLQQAGRYSDAQTWMQYIFDPTNQEQPATYWPLNMEPDHTFIDVKNGVVLSAGGTTQQANQTVPFALEPRNITVFSPDSCPVVQTPFQPQLNSSEITINVWVQLAAVPPQNSKYTVLSSYDTSGGYWLVANGTGNNTYTYELYAATANSGNIFCISKTRTFTAGNWEFVTARIKNGLCHIYINGKSSNSEQTPQIAFKPATTAPFCVGSILTGTIYNYYFNGSIADVMVFNRPLDKAEILEIYTNYATANPAMSYWKFAPFRRINATSLYHILRGDRWQSSFMQPDAYYTASMQMAVYEYDPFDPDTIARLRVNSWQKATFMKYISNLISWGDAQFTQDTWETLSDAGMRYVLAATLLGPLPLKNVSEEPAQTVNYNTIEAEYGPANVPVFLIETENNLAALPAAATLPQQLQSVVDAYFCIPSNKQMLTYWELVADRLYKLRNGLTITGAKNDIPLFAPPADPGSLVNAASVSNTADYGTTAGVPAFRFSYMVAQAKSVTGEVIRLGNELLAALEKKDAEKLSQLQSGYQLVLNNLTALIKTSQINQLLYTGEGLQASLVNAQLQRDTYNTWLQMPVSTEEQYALDQLEGAMIEQGIGIGVRTVAVFSYLLPTIYGLADGGFNPGESLNATAGVADGAAQLLNTRSQQVSQQAQFTRRSEEWTLQKNIATNQVLEIEAQIEANNFSLEAAYREMNLTQVQIQQSQEVCDFLRTKFTSEELYDWLSGQLSGLYFQMFQLAWSLAQSAQTALQYELNLNQSYLNSAAWNASYQGLLAGDSLSLALQQMENAYISGSSRKLEIRKTWSMRQNDPEALLTLVSTGNCRFDINERSYDLEFPGHYNRKIKSLSVTIPAVVGPYQNIHASLTQTGNTVVIKPSDGAVKYLLGMPNSPLPSDGSLRVNWNPNQEIIISTGVNDAGMFQVNFNDEQYLPFEGTGAVSSWNLSIPQAANAFDLSSISDVIITVEYTAEDGGATFRSQVTALEPVQKFNGWQYISMRQLFGAAWFNFCTNPVTTTDPVATTYSLSFELVKQMYPANLSDVMLGNAKRETGIYFVTAAGISVSDMKLNMNDGATGTCPLPGNLLEIKHTDSDNNDTGPVPLPGKGNPWALHVTTAPADIITDGKIDQTKLLDIILVMPFSGTLSW